ncbi:MAG: flippase-like domain-containing protein [Desulfobacterales bacterium]|nr:flippase-like domain-containing protein [Desulfobacterales bacterium]
MKNNMAISFGLGLAASLAALYFAFRNVPFGELTAYLTTINYAWILPAGAMVAASFIFRGLRWRVILLAAKPVSFREAFHPLMIGFMMNCVLPGRVGELARPIILQKKSGVPFSTGLATVAVERVFDLLMMFFILAAVLSFITMDAGHEVVFGDYHLNKDVLEAVRNGMLKLFAGVIAGIAAFSVGAVRGALARLILWSPAALFFAGPDLKEKIRRKVCVRLVGVMNNFAAGFALVRNVRAMGASLALSVIVWLLAALSYYTFSLGCPGVGLTFTEMSAVLIIICFFIALPSVPGFWGLWEAGGVFAMALFGVPAGEAAGFTLANHFIQIAPIIVIGLWSALTTGVDIRKISREKKNLDAPAEE